MDLNAISREFDKILVANQLGGRHPHESETDSSLKAIYSQVVDGLVEHGKQFSKSNDCIIPFPEMYAGIASSTRVNAAAFAMPDVYCVAVCKGVFPVLVATFRRLLSDPRVFTWIGDVSKETNALALPPISREASTLLPAHFAFPRDSDRTQAAAFMMACALDYIILHEIRHIINGHVRYYEQYLGLGLLLEVDAAEGDPESKIKEQALEFDADGYASVTLLAKFFSPDGPSFPIEKIGFLHQCTDKPRALCTLVLASVLAVTKLLNPAPRAISDWEKVNHPPSDVRRFAILKHTADHMNKWGHNHLVEDRNLTEEVLQSVDDVLHNILGLPAITEEWKRDLTREGNIGRYCARLHATWLAIQPELEKYSHIKMNAL